MSDNWVVLFFLVGVVKTCGSLAEIKRPEQALKLFIRFTIASAGSSAIVIILICIFLSASVYLFGQDTKDDFSAEALGTGDTLITRVASAQLGNVGGLKFCRWYGFNGRVEWCAIFVTLMELRYDGKWYQLSPWALMWDDEKYYLVAFDAKHGKIVAPDSVVEQMKTEINRLVEQYK